MKEIELTDEQKQQVIAEFKKDPDLKRITQVVSGDPEADGRSKIGRAIRSFLASQDKQYHTTKPEPVKAVEFTEEQKQFILSDRIDEDLNPLEIARIVFGDEDIKSLSIQHRATIDFLKEYRPAILDDNELVTKDKWTPPNAVSKVVKKVNDWAGEELNSAVLSNKHEKMMQKLIKYLHSPRFKHTINEYCKIADRELFESEFVRATWDKVDLSVEEINQYINLCANFVRVKHIQSRLDRLNKVLEDSGSNQEASMRFTELIKTTSEELDKCEKRIDALSKGLNGSRQERLKARGQRNGTIESLVEAFQDKEERDRMVKMAEMRLQTVSDVADELERMDEFKSRVLGISKEELL